MSQIFPFHAYAEPAPQLRWYQGKVVRHFTPNWFAVTMGTGILSVALAQFPSLRTLWYIGQGLWLFNIVLFAGFSFLYLVRWMLYPREAAQVFSHSMLSMFFGCIPMGLATIINGFLIYGTTYIGRIAVDIAYGLWWVDAAMAVACGIGIPFMMFTRQDHSVDTMSGIWLLPVVACEVASVSGGLLLLHILAPGEQLAVLMISYILWALSMPLAISILVILFLRMAVHKLPPVGIAASSWLSLGPIGTGALSMFTLYQTAPKVLSANELGPFAIIAGIPGFWVECFYGGMGYGG